MKNYTKYLYKSLFRSDYYVGRLVFEEFLILVAIMKIEETLYNVLTDVTGGSNSIVYGAALGRLIASVIVSLINIVGRTYATTKC